MPNNFYYFCLIFLDFLTIDCRVTVSKTTDRSINGFYMSDFIIEHGYPVQVHKNIQTTDGYLLDLFRIPYGRKKQTNKGPILLMHGLLGNPENYIVLGPERALAFLLADRGYDVWIGGARGTTHSRKHVKLNPDRDFQFWNFTWHEIGVYDLPAYIDYVLNRTQSKNLAYIGHSQGTTAFFVLTSMRPRYNRLIKVMVGLAPVTFLGAENLIVNQPERSTLHQQYENYRRMGKIGEVGPEIDQLICNQPYSTPEMCMAIKGLLGATIINPDAFQIDQDSVPLILQTVPDNASYKQILHYTQLILSGNFSQYDYGVEKNRKLYGSREPPVYNLNRITAPVGILAALADHLSTINNVQRLRERLPNVVLYRIIQHPFFAHGDFIAAKDVVELVYNTIFDLLRRYE